VRGKVPTLRSHRPWFSTLNPKSLSVLLEHSSASALDTGEGAEEEEVDDQGDEEGGGDAEMEVDEAGGDAMRE
jgi:hypothetical protein